MQTWLWGARCDPIRRDACIACAGGGVCTARQRSCPSHCLLNANGLQLPPTVADVCRRLWCGDQTLMKLHLVQLVRLCTFKYRTLHLCDSITHWRCRKRGPPESPRAARCFRGFLFPSHLRRQRRGMVGTASTPRTWWWSGC